MIKGLREKYFWGYAPEYYLSSQYHCSPTYAAWYYKEKGLPIEKVETLLDKISEEKRISFDCEYAQELYRKEFGGK